MRTAARAWGGVAALLVLATANAETAAWKVVPDVTLRETYTDNVFLGAGPRTHDFITEVTPGIVIDGRSPRLSASLVYRPSALVYARESEFNDVINNLAGSARLEAVQNFFYVDAAASITQNFISPFAPQPGEITVITPNRFESRTVSLSPYLRGQVGSALEYELRSSQAWTHNDSDALGDVYTRRWSGRITSPVRRFGSSLEYEDTRTEYDEFRRQPDQESRLVRARLHYQPDPTWRFSASAGAEENNFVLQQMQSEAIYGGGVSWRPSARTSAEFEYEHRYFGPYRLARLEHRTRLSAWTLGYVRDATNYQTEALRLPPGNTAALLDAIFRASVPDPNERRAAVERFVRASGTPASLSTPLSFYTERVFLREAVDASFAILGARNSITFTAFYAENAEISPDAAALFPDPFLLGDRFTQRGFGAHASHRLGPFTSIGASASVLYTRRDEPVRSDARDDYATLTLDYTVSPQTNAFAGVSISRFDSEGAVLSNRDSASVFVGLRHRF